jgi:hypothetical protein
MDKTNIFLLACFIILFYLFFTNNSKKDIKRNENQIKISNNISINNEKNKKNKIIEDKVVKNFNKHDNTVSFRGLSSKLKNIEDRPEIGGSKSYNKYILSDKNINENKIYFKKYNSYRIKPTTLAQIKKTRKTK